MYSNGSTTLPRGFRYHHEEDRPKTPDFTVNEPVQPSPPRPSRLKVKRRNVSSLQAPTDQFLASVAAADVPLPTIELPVNISEDLDMPDREEDTLMDSSGLLAPQNYSSRFASPPKTPMPSLSIDAASSQRPDWSLGASSPDDYFTRPTSSLSTSSDFSDDSFYSGSRLSRPSDDGSCTSPESDAGDPFQFPSISKGKGKSIVHEAAAPFITLNGKLYSKHRKDAPWTKAMNEHLWSTYLIYLQDPTVTPFRIGAGAVPPEGVCYRVAREARRSWKGPKAVAPAVRRSARLSSVPRASEKSGSNTPTENPKVYAQWPHSSSATRNHLRELCKNKDTTPVQRHLHLQSRSPTPFTKPFERNRLRTPEPCLTSFNTKDIALSLTASTAESMQPDGPLARLASDSSSGTALPDPKFVLEDYKKKFDEDYKPVGFGRTRGSTIGREDGNRGRRLGSPFFARTYGPSSSKILATRPSPPRAESDITVPRLRSPFGFDKAQSLTGTAKRRAQHDLEDELSPNGAVLRPSILDEQLFGTPLGRQRRVRSRGFSLGDEVFRPRAHGLFPPARIEEPVSQPKPAPKLLPSATFNPVPRLGSPFSESGPSQTFPRRLFQDGTTTIRRNAFATMHHTRHSIESFDFGDGPSRPSRLEQLDMKLKEIQEREAATKR
ncbi:hypothetical protein LSUE1_G010216 [Lachnellula suecica]|uniref:Uncharacterized protein n=1 Tax=Lachnellula suecica TaxID=602035 RepID=A0A8T9BUD3_9HELO|nr:hypothetical protein LSUE1_G010216 [Lachnellula suecica]